MATRRKPKDAVKRSGRWTLTRKGEGAVLRYEVWRSDKSLALQMTGEQLRRVAGLARKADPAAIRDLLLPEETRDSLLTNPALSSLVSANTWRWVLPLFGGPEPPRRPAKRFPGP